MKIVKIKFVGFWKGFNERKNIYYDILSQRYKVELSDNPEYIIASMMGNPIEYLKYKDCIRIFHSGEDFFPDMNIFDYAVGYDEAVVKGVTDNGLVNRYFRWPYGCEWNLFEIKKHLKSMSEEEAVCALKDKKRFCNYIYGHPSYKGRRERLLEELSNYKRVDSAGVYKNNMPNGRIVDFNDKIAFIKDYKFCIAAETLQYPGMTTEKIYDSYRAKCVPIYYGNPFVKDTFNEKSFIFWDGKEESLKGVIDRIMEVDNDDNQYISMLMEPKIKEDKDIDVVLDCFKKWIYSIFDYEIDGVMLHLKEEDYSLRVEYEKMLHDAFARKERPLVRLFMKG